MKRGLCKRKFFRNCKILSKFIFIRKYNYHNSENSRKHSRTDSLRAIYIDWNISLKYPLAAIISRRSSRSYEGESKKLFLFPLQHLNLYSIYNNELLIIFTNISKNSTTIHRNGKIEGARRKNENPFRAEKDYYGARSSEEDDTVLDSKERISHRHWPSAAFPLLFCTRA